MTKYKIYVIIILINKNMHKGFWKEIQEKTKSENRPIYTLAPMADVTDAAFRYMIAKYGKPDVTWTEFVSCNGLMSAGREVLKRDLEYNEIERPIVAQLFTSEIENMEGAAKLCLELGFDGVDINMGCPVNTIGKQGAGAALIKDPELAKEIIKAAQRGAILKNETGEIIKQIPVSVKTRLGYHQVNEYRDWLENILSCDVPVLSLHLRTKQEMSMVPAHYELIDEVYDFVKEKSPETIFIINGDIKDLKHSQELYEKYKIDGVMIGRGIFGTPWLFNKERSDQNLEYSLKEKLEIMLEHTKLFQEKLSDIKSFAIMKKHYKAYVNGFDGAKELREKLFETNDYDEVEKIVNKYIESL
jgi:nifR3 family TIM-barrel protein